MPAILNNQHNAPASSARSWKEAGTYQDIKYHKSGKIAKITINRPHVRNAFRPLTVDEMMHALNDARHDPEIGVIILTGEGKEAFCSGGDQKIRGSSGYQDQEGSERLNILDFQRQIRTCPKPVIAMVAGYSIGGGHHSTMWAWLALAPWAKVSPKWPPKLAPRSFYSTCKPQRWKKPFRPSNSNGKKCWKKGASAAIPAQPIQHDCRPVSVWISYRRAIC